MTIACARTGEPLGCNSDQAARNPTFLKMLAARLAPAKVGTANDAGWSADALEAQAFAYMAVRHMRGMPITFPTTTGVAKPLCGGKLAKLH
jgi:anhydro-N-acetylmuramic acid kinase